MHTSSRVLVIMRHASAQSHAMSDQARELLPEGRRDAAAAGGWLRTIGVSPDGALVSSAARTTATWEEVALAGGFGCVATSSQGLYAAEPDSALDLVRSTSEEVGSLVVVGHNPTMGTLAQLLDSGDGDPAAASGMLAGFPTCSLAVFEFAGPWSSLAPGGAALEHFHVARAD